MDTLHAAASPIVTHSNYRAASNNAWHWRVRSSFIPPVVLMDEPLGALDKNLRQAIQLQLKEIHQRVGMTVVYVTHDQEEAMNMSDRIAIMNHGRIVQAGSPGEVYEQPVNPFVGRFLGEAIVSRHARDRR